MASETTTMTPPVTWAQRQDSVYITINLPDVKDANITLTANKLTFTCVAHRPPRDRGLAARVGRQPSHGPHQRVLCVEKHWRLAIGGRWARWIGGQGPGKTLR